MREEKNKNNLQTDWWRGFYKQFAPSCQYDDWHPDVMRNLDAQAWVNMFEAAGFDCIHPDSKPHSGNAYYRTDRDHTHLGLRGKDFLGELINLCHMRGIKVVTNQSIFFDNYLFKEHPDWRIRDADGRDSKSMNIAGYRLGIVCMNSPYKDEVCKQIKAYLEKYPIDGIFFDEMFIFIPVCYCNHCRKRYLEETGAELPDRDDRKSLAYRRYVKWRDNRLYEFLSTLVESVHSVRPDIPVTFNSPRVGPRPYSPLRLLDFADFASGDPVPWEGSIAKAAFAISYWENATPNLPANMHIGRFQRKDTQNGMMSLENLISSFALCMAHGCSFQAARETKPNGMLYPSTFKLYKQAFDTLGPMEPYWGGEKVRCVGVYYSWDTKRNLIEFHSESPAKLHTRDAINRLANDYYSGLRVLFNAFQDGHIPVDIISRRNLNQFDQFDLICLPDTLSLRAEEVDALRDFVSQGGKLLATRYASLADEDENVRSNFALADVFGVDYLGKTQGYETFIESNGALKRSAGIPEDFEVMVGQQAIVRAKPGAKVLGRIVLPYTNRDYDSHQWVNIWTTPPGLAADHPAIVVNDYGKGQCCYLSWQFAKAHLPSHVHTPPSMDEPKGLILSLSQSLIETPQFSVEAP
ncbi:MAG: beta-galactosidase trimerization domain-containing protein, partial [Anaerolineales bacterium]